MRVTTASLCVGTQEQVDGTCSKTQASLDGRIGYSYRLVRDVPLQGKKRDYVCLRHHYAMVSSQMPMAYREIGAHAERFESLSADGVSEKDMKSMQHKWSR